MTDASAIPIVAMPPRDDRRDRAEHGGDRARLERAELVRARDEDHLDCAHASAQLVRRDERDGGRPDVDADHVDETGDRERDERSGSQLRQAPDDVRCAEQDDDRDQRRPGRTTQRPPCQDQRGAERTDRRRGAKDAEPDRPDVEDLLRVDRQQRDPAAEEHREEIEGDRAEQHPRPPDEPEPADEPGEPDGLVGAVRPDPQSEAIEMPPTRKSTAATA